MGSDTVFTKRGRKKMSGSYKKGIEDGLTSTPTAKEGSVDGAFPCHAYETVSAAHTCNAMWLPVQSEVSATR
jgi:hypothetical protein